MIHKIILFIGLVKLAEYLLHLFWILKRHFMLTPHDLLNRYFNDKSSQQWALVTGGGDGMGAEFCRQLSRQGFNIILVSRTASKMEKVAKECNPNVQTKIITKDFTGDPSIQFYEKLRDEVKDLNITILVINAGLALTGSAEKATAKQFQDMIDCNSYQVAMLARVMMPILPKKAGIIVTSSVASFKWMPQQVVYSATKAFATFLVKGIAAENKNLHKFKDQKIPVDDPDKQLDVQCLCPSFTATNIFTSKLYQMLSTTPTKVVSRSLGALGQKDQTMVYGTLYDEITGRMLTQWLGHSCPPAFNTFINFLWTQIGH